VEAGEPFDVVVIVPALLDDVVKQGKVAGDSRAIIARAGNGLAIRAGAPRPDIATADAFKATLLNAKSIAYAKAGQSGVYFVGLIDRLGIAGAVKPKGSAEAGGAGGRNRGARGA